MNWMDKFQPSKEETPIVENPVEIFQGLKKIFGGDEKAESAEVAKLKKCIKPNNFEGVKFDPNADFDRFLQGINLPQELPQKDVSNSPVLLDTAVPENAITQYLAKETGSLANRSVTSLVPVEKEPQKTPAKVLVTESKAPTPLEMMEMLIKQVLFVLIDKALFWFDGSAYRLLEESDLHRLIFKVCKFDIYKHGKPKVVNEIANFLRMTDDVKNCRPLRSPHLFAFPNGYYHADINVFEATNPRYFCTSLLNANYMSIETASCPVFDEYLFAFTRGDPTVIQLIWQILGYLFSNNVSAKKLFYFYGSHNTSKSMLLAFIGSCFEDESTASVDVHTLNERFVMSTFVGKHINIHADLKGGTLNSGTVSRIKQLVSGLDKIPAEKKFGQPFQFENTCKLVFASNHPLTLPHNEYDLIDKVIAIPCFNYIPREQRDPTILERLKREKDSIIRMAIEHYKQLAANNLIFAGEDILTPELVFSMGDQRGNIELNLRDFVARYCVFEEDAYIHTQTLNDRFKALYNIEIDTPTFSVHLKAICGERITPHKRRLENSNRNGYCNIRLKEDNESVSKK